MVLLMIVSSHYSTTAAKVISKNAVKVLATLFLLSFAKLLRTIIAALSFTGINVINGPTKIVWVYDGNIEYLHGKHIYLFLAGLLAYIVLLIPYTLALTFVQCLKRRSGSRALFWVARLKPLIDAYTGPYKDKYSFWGGLLLMVRSLLFLVFAFNALGEPGLNLLATGLTGFSLAVLLWGLHGVYKQWPLSILESLSFFNIGLLSMATMYVKMVGGNQVALTYISVGTAFLTFTAVFVYHTYKCAVLSRAGKKLRGWYTNRYYGGLHEYEMVQMPHEEEEAGVHSRPQVKSVELRFDQNREPLLVDITD